MEASSIQFRELIALVNKKFYDAVFKDAWLKLIFAGVEQEHIEAQQTDFMVGAFGGPKNYSGRPPDGAHPHIFIQEEMWQVRNKCLVAAFAEANFPDELAEKWLRIDNAFKARIIKKLITDCSGRWRTEAVICIADPLKRKF